MTGTSLPQAVNTPEYFPTPAATDGERKSETYYRGKGNPTLLGAARNQVDEGRNGQLNPEWVAWLMGFPTGWTDLEDSETP
jgi:hypothetical protein